MNVEEIELGLHSEHPVGLGDSHDGTYTKNKSYLSASNSSIKSKIRRQRSAACKYPEPDIEIPKDGDLLAFSARDIITILICLNIDPPVINRIQIMQLNGRKFSTLSDEELKDLGLENPIIKYFRDRSKRKSKFKSRFCML